MFLIVDGYLTYPRASPRVCQAIYDLSQYLLYKYRIITCTKKIQCKVTDKRVVTLVRPKRNSFQSNNYTYSPIDNNEMIVNDPDL